MSFKFIYDLIYLSMLFFIVPIVVRDYKGLSPSLKYNNILLGIYTIIFIVFFGQRDLSVGTDTTNYMLAFDLVDKDFISESGKDKGFYFLILLLKYFRYNIQLFFTIMAALYLVPFYFAIKKTVSGKSFVFLFVSVSFFFFLSMGINVLKQGIALSFFLLGMTLWTNANKLKSSICFFIACTFHIATIIIILSYFISIKFPKLILPTICFFLSIVISFIGIDISGLIRQIPLIGDIFESRALGYITTETTYKVGFRYNFVIFNFFFALIGYYFLIKRRISSIISYYPTVFSTYLYCSSIFFLMFNSAYSDRYGLMSWILIPFLIEPFLISEKESGKSYLIPLLFFCLLIHFIL